MHEPNGVGREPTRAHVAVERLHLGRRELLGLPAPQGGEEVVPGALAVLLEGARGELTRGVLEEERYELSHRDVFGGAEPLLVSRDEELCQPRLGLFHGAEHRFAVVDALAVSHD